VHIRPFARRSDPALLDYVPQAVVCETLGTSWSLILANHGERKTDTVQALERKLAAESLVCMSVNRSTSSVKGKLENKPPT
jgi:hypothetical protein